jgi:membrane-associated phospholipid phosphatase
LGSIFILFFFDKGEFELSVNRNHDPYLDVFFFYVTYLGDGRVSVIILALIFFRRIYYGILALVSFLASVLVTQSMKRLIFSEYPRPSKFFEKQIDLHLVDGVDLHTYFSFPSGHASGAFSIFMILALISKNKLHTFVFFMLSLLVAFSRIYLLQHFFIDTFFGAWIAIIIAFFVYYYLNDRSNLPEKENLQRPLLKILQKK